MRLVRRVLATTVATLALAAGGLVVATPASATPEDGKGCVGLPSLPDTYVCVISATPTNVVPTATTTPIYVTVPKVCYFLDCTAAQVVAVPVPGVAEGSGQIAVLWYKGQYIPIAVGTAPVLKTVSDVINLATATLYNTVLPLVNDVYYDVVYTIDDVLNSLPTTGEVIEAIYNELDYALYIVCWAYSVYDPYTYCYY